MNALVDELEAVLVSLHREDGEGRMFALTVALTPAREPDGDATGGADT